MNIKKKITVIFTLSISILFVLALSFLIYINHRNTINEIRQSYVKMIVDINIKTTLIKDLYFSSVYDEGKDDNNYDKDIEIDKINFNLKDISELKEYKGYQKALVKSSLGDYLIISEQEKKIIKKGLFEYINDIGAIPINISNKGIIKDIGGQWYMFFTYKTEVGGTITFAKNITNIFNFTERLIIIAIIIFFIIAIILYGIGLKVSDLYIRPIEEKNKRLKDFSNNVSHELKTPLTIMLSDIELLKFGYDKELLDEMETEVKKMNDIIKSLLFIASNYTDNIDKEKIYIKKIIYSVLADIKISNNINITGINDKTTIICNNILFNMLLTNIFINIKKYGEEKSIIIKKLDNKITISNQIKEKIKIDNPNELLEDFIQGDNSRNKEGYGLGLSIIKKICDIHGWDINISIENNIFSIEILNIN